MGVNSSVVMARGKGGGAGWRWAKVGAWEHKETAWDNGHMLPRVDDVLLSCML